MSFVAGMGPPPPVDKLWTQHDPRHVCDERVYIYVTPFWMRVVFPRATFVSVLTGYNPVYCRSCVAVWIFLSGGDKIGG